MPPTERRALLSDEVHVSGPPRTTGRLRCALLFPNQYALGMPNLGFQTVYRLLAAHPDTTCERAFFPPVPGGSPSGKLRSLETERPLADCDLLAISSSFELDWLRIPAALEAAGLPPLAADRDIHHPLVVVGGPAVTANPEPLAPFADATFIGEVEEVFPDLVAALTEDVPGSSVRRSGLLEALASLPGFYVPSRPPAEPVARVAVRDLEPHETRTEIITPHAEFPTSFLIEVGRGCPRSCRFCLARRIYEPLRTRSVAALLTTARLGLQFTDRVGLVGAAVADYPELPALAGELVAMGARVSTSSLRAERVTPELLEPLAVSGQRTITLAPETADERLAERIGKRIRPAAVRSALAAALEAGVRGLKLYFMVGIPGETEAQALRIADYVAELQHEFPSARLTVVVNPLVPKPHTEFARVPVPGVDTMRSRLAAVGRALRSKTRARARLGSARWSAVQTALSRGGRELAPVLLTAARAGGGAGDFFSALRAEGLVLDDYLGAQTADGPWEVVDPCPVFAGEAGHD